MFENLKQMVENLKNFLIDKEEVLGLIVIGSVARDDAYADESDLDGYVVLTDEAFGKKINYQVEHLVVEPSCGIGLEPVTYNMLLDFAEKGTEFRRYSFKSAKVVFSKIDGLEEVVKEIYTYQAEEKDEKITDFYCQMLFDLSFLEYGEYSGNFFVLSQRALGIFYFGGRLIMAYNNLICPPSKKFLEVFQEAPWKPKKIVEMGRALLENPSIEKARNYIERIALFFGCKEPDEGFFIRASNNNFRWKKQLPPLEEF